MAVHLITSLQFRNRMGKVFETLFNQQRIFYTWTIQDDMSVSQIRNAAYSNDNIILENNFDSDLFKYAIYKNCLYVDSSPFRTFGYLFDNDGWADRSRICNQTRWRQPLTKLAARRMIKYREDHGIKKERSNIKKNILFIPSKTDYYAKYSTELIKSNQVNIDRILTDASFPEKTIEIVRDFAKKTDTEYMHYKSNGIRLNKCNKIISDYIETTILALQYGISTFCISPSILSGSHVCQEYMGDIGFLENIDEVLINTNHVDSVIYRLMTEIVPVTSSPDDLKINPSICEFLSIATGKMNNEKIF